MAETPPVHPEFKRKLTALEKLGIAVTGGTSLIGALAIYGSVKTHFWTREEGIAQTAAQEALSKQSAAALKTIQDQMRDNNVEQTRVVERKVDKILEFMKDDKAQAQRDIDRMERRLENVELVVMQPNNNKKSKGDK